MGKSSPKVSAFAVFSSHRHQGRHRGTPTAGRETRFARVKTKEGESVVTPVDQVDRTSDPTGFYVTFANVPAVPSNQDS